MTTMMKNTLAAAMFACALASAQSKPAAPVAATAPAQSRPADRTPLPSQATVDAFIKRMFGHDPNLRWRVLEIRASESPQLAHVIVSVTGQPRAIHLYVTPDGQHAVIGDLVPFGADPFAGIRERLEREAKGPAKGPVNAPVTIVEFADLQCSSCKNAEPILQRLLAEVNHVRFVFQHFPLTEIHPWSLKASAYAECVAAQSSEAFWRFTQAVYDQQATITAEKSDAAFTDLAKAAGADGAVAAKCAASAETAAKVNASRELGRSLGVNATPTFFINGRKLTGVNSIPFDVLKRIVQHEASYAAPAPSAPR